MKVIINDGGRAAAGFKGDAGDCVTRSIAIASGRPYAEVYAALSEGSRNQRVTRGKRPKSGARNGVNTTRQWFKDYMAGLGFRWVPTMAIGSGCKVHLHDGELPMGNLVVAVSKHYTAVIDGVIHDTFDPQRETYVFKAGVQNGRDAEVSHVARRCVYGYWVAA